MTVRLPTTPWPWTISTLGCPDLDLPAAVALARAHGLSRLELRLLEGRSDLPQLLAQRFGSPAGLAAWCRQQGMRICALDASANLAGLDAVGREELVALVPWAQALEVPYLRIFDGGRYTSEPERAELAPIAAAWTWWCEQRAAAGWTVDLMLETHDACRSARHVQALQELVQRPIPILWDAHHPWFASHEDPLHTWDAIRQQVVHIHIKDSLRQANAQFPYTYVLPGAGDFPLASLLQRLRADGYRGPVSLEWELAWHRYLPPVGAALDALARLAARG
ncbi:MAG: sugar phosphate isomerase/epimerase family protein [Planctomycetota bacterium]